MTGLAVAVFVAIVLYLALVPIDCSVTLDDGADER